MGTAFLTDPLLKLIDPEEMPNTFLAMPDEEQMWRGRLYLKYVWGFRDKPYSWTFALTDPADPCKGDIDATPDEVILGMMRAYEAEIAVGTGEDLVRE